MEWRKEWICVSLNDIITLFMNLVFLTNWFSGFRANNTRQFESLLHMLEKRLLFKAMRLTLCSILPTLLL